jgi:MFS family permease
MYSSELQEDDARGTALAQEFQANIFGLNMAFIINVAVTHTLGKWNQWAWRIPIIVMQVYPALLFAVSSLLPETPRWCVLHGDNERARRSIKRVFGEDQVEDRANELIRAHKKEEEEGTTTYADMLWPGGSQFHPTVVTVMGQVNQALTGYGAVSVYGPQIFELLGFGVNTAELLTLGNYVFYFLMMTVAWVLIDRVGRRKLMVNGALWLAISFALLTVLGGLAFNGEKLSIPLLATGIPGIVVLYLATSVFGVGWLVPPWLIPTEIYPSTTRAKGAAVSVITWGLANFTITLLTPIGFNNLEYYLFLVFAVTNAFAGVWTYLYCPESGHRTFEENQDFFKEAVEKGSWIVSRVRDGEFKVLPDAEGEGDEEQEIEATGNRNESSSNKQTTRDAHEETTPLLGRTSSP